MEQKSIKNSKKSIDYKTIIELLSTDGINSRGIIKKWLENAKSSELKGLIISLNEEMAKRIIKERINNKNEN